MLKNENTVVYHIFKHDRTHLRQAVPISYFLLRTSSRRCCKYFDTLPFICPINKEYIYRFYLDRKLTWQVDYKTVSIDVYFTKARQGEIIWRINKSIRRYNFVAERIARFVFSWCISWNACSWIAEFKN